MCQCMMIKYKIKRVYYSNSKGEIEISSPQKIESSNFSKGTNSLISNNPKEFYHIWYELGIIKLKDSV